MGCVLGQHDETGKKDHVIYYLSKRFTDCEQRYSALERTCCSLAWAAHRLRQYMLSHTTLLISKMDPIKYIFEKPALIGRIARRQMLLSEYELSKAVSLQTTWHTNPYEDYQSMQPEFPNEEILILEDDNNENTWTLFFDGASNALGHGIGVVLISHAKQYIPMTTRLCFNCTNNTTKYKACVMGIRAAIEFGAKCLEVYGDSALVVQ